MGRFLKAFDTIAALTVLMLATGRANADVLIDITQMGGDVDVTATGSLNLTGATFDHSQSYSTGIIPGGSNWYVALGTSPGMDWYQLTSVTLPFGISRTYVTSSLTSGDAFSIWGFSGGVPLVGLSTGYISGTSISSNMTLSGETIAGLTLNPGTYTFTIPDDSITLKIAASPEPSTLAMMLSPLAALGFVVGYRRLRKTSASQQHPRIEI